MRSHKLEARIFQEETFLAAHYGLPQADPFLAAKELRRELSSDQGAQ